MKLSLPVVAICLVAGCASLGVGCGGDDDSGALRAVIEGQSTQIAGLQTALAPEVDATVEPTATPRPTLVETEVPLIRAYAAAALQIAAAMPDGGANYAVVVESPLIQEAFDAAFRRAQEVLHASSGFVNGPDRDCVVALQNWARFATDYWNSLARGAREQNVNRWNYALSFESELFNTARVWPEKCPALKSALDAAEKPSVQ